jgi:hypothetical protein
MTFNFYYLNLFPNKKNLKTQSLRFFLSIISLIYYFIQLFHLKIILNFFYLLEKNLFEIQFDLIFAFYPLNLIFAILLNLLPVEK